MNNFEMELKWHDEVNEKKYYKSQTDRLKRRSFVYPRLPIVNKYSIDMNDIRSIVYSDVYSRYLTYKGFNSLLPASLNNTSQRLYDNVKNNILSKDDPYTNLKNNAYNDIFEMDICVDLERRFESHNKEFIYFIQDAFNNLYTKNLVVKDKLFYLDFSNIKKEVINELINNNMFDKLKPFLEYEVGLKIDFKTSTNVTINTLIKEPEYIYGLNAIVIRGNNPIAKKFIVQEEKEYIYEALKMKKCIGVFSGSFAINPINNNEIPIIISNHFKDDIKVINPNSTDEEIFFSSILGLEYNNIFKFDNNEKTLINSDFLNGNNISEARKIVIEYALEKGFATYYEDIKKTKIEISEEYDYGISIPSYVDDIIQREHYPVLIDRKNNIKTLNGKLSDKNIINQVFNTNITQAFLSVACRVKSKIGITNYSSKDFILDFKDYPNFDYAIFNNSIEYFYTLVLNMIILNDLKLEFNNIFDKLLIEGSFFDDLGREVIRENNNLIDINSLIKRYGACSLRFSMLKVNIGDNYYYNQDELNIFSTIINQFKNIYNTPFLSEYKELDNKYKQLVEVSTNCIESNDLPLYLKNLNDFINIVNENKKISLKQAKGLLILFSLVAPSICEIIYKEVFDSSYPLMFESWPI